MLPCTKILVGKIIFEKIFFYVFRKIYVESWEHRIDYFQELDMIIHKISDKNIRIL